MSRLIIISNRLTSKVVVEKDQSVRLTSGQGGIASGLRSIYKQKNNLWVGWPGIFSKKESDKKEIRKQLAREQQYPVFLSKEEIAHFYHGFCNETLWPNFHYFNQYTHYRSKDWRTYCAVNEKYVREILKVSQPDDTFWVHDYQLLLLPQLLREALPEASIGFFLHTPFPDLSSFSRLPWRCEILNGMLGADILGFHTYDNVRNFLFNVYRLLGIPHLYDTLRLSRRVVRIECIPMGIDYKKYEESAQLPETQRKIRRLQAGSRKAKIILSIDRLDYTKGIPQRLRAFDMFLTRYPSYRGKVSMLLIVVPSREEVHYYKQLKEEIDLLVGQINGKHANMDWEPIRYFYRSFTLSWLSTFYVLADVALISPLIDGMNLVCKEFIASKKDSGVLILSEAAGSSKELYEALLVNPHDSEDLVKKIHQALRMSQKEQKRRLRQMQDILRKHNIQHWINLFTQHLQESKAAQIKLRTQYLDKEEQIQLRKRFVEASRRLIFLDYDGTLVSFSPHPMLAAPDKDLLDLLEKLTKDNHNRVVIISGRERSILSKWLGHLPLYLVAEHGACTKSPNKTWKADPTPAIYWKKDIRNILEELVARTPGSFIEEKHASLVWHFRKVDPSFGEMRAWELVNHLRYILLRMNLSILEGNKVVEIKNPEVNKGRATQNWLKHYEPDFVLAFGDDHTDEDTFSVLPEDSYSVKVGAGASAARYWVEDCAKVRQLLKYITDDSI